MSRARFAAIAAAVVGAEGEKQEKPYEYLPRIERPPQARDRAAQRARQRRQGKRRVR